MKHARRLEMLKVIAESVPKVGAGRLAASVWMGNKLVSVGINSLKTHPIQKRFASNPERIFLHAETDAIAKARNKLDQWQFEQSILYVARMREGESGDMVQGNSKSCDGCISCATHFGISRIIYTEDNSGYSEIRL